MPWRTRYRLTASARRSESFLLYASPPTESVCPSITTLVSGLSLDRKSTRLNSSHGYISYAVFCLKKKKNKQHTFSWHRSSFIPSEYAKTRNERSDTPPHRPSIYSPPQLRLTPPTTLVR